MMEPDAPIVPETGEGSVEQPPADQVEIDKAFARQTFDHVRTGVAGDDTIYVNNDGYMVKLDRRGTQYKCDL